MSLATLGGLAALLCFTIGVGASALSLRLGPLAVACVGMLVILYGTGCGVIGLWVMAIATTLLVVPVSLWAWVLQRPRPDAAPPVGDPTLQREQSS